MDLKEFIVPKVLGNTDNNIKEGNKAFETKDLIYLDDIKTAEYEYRVKRICYPTDYAVLTGAVMTEDEGVVDDRQSCWTWLRSAITDIDASFVDGYGNLLTIKDIFDMEEDENSDNICDLDVSIRPALQLNLSSVISAKNASPEIFKIDDHKEEGKVVYHTIEFGEYPKTFVGNKLDKYLENAMKTGNLKETGKKYIGNFYKDNDNNEIPSYNKEYILDGDRFVRVICVDPYDDDRKLSNGFYAPSAETPVWVKVEPIKWIIRNWKDMPREINPTGTGRAKVMELKTEEAIVAGIPFYPNDEDENRSLWQNSTIRAYLNGYNVNFSSVNNNSEFAAPSGGDFRKHNFLTEALSNNLTSINLKATNENKKVVNKKQRKGYGVIVLDRPMTINEQIKFYIQTGKSFMLHGPSGVGKTRRIEEADPDFVSIVLRNGILPEEVIGKTIYPNNDKTKAGIWVPPAWYDSLCE